MYEAFGKTSLVPPQYNERIKDHFLSECLLRDPAAFFDREDQSYVFPSKEVVDNETGVEIALRVPVNDIRSVLEHMPLPGNFEVVDGVPPEGFPIDFIEMFQEVVPNADIVKGRIVFMHNGKKYSFSYPEAQKFLEEEFPYATSTENTLLEWLDTAATPVRYTDVPLKNEEGHKKLLSLIQKNVDPLARGSEDGKLIVKIGGEDKKITWGMALSYLNEPEGFRVSMQDGIPKENMAPRKDEALPLEDTGSDADGPDTVPHPLHKFDIEKTLSPDHIRAIYDKYRSNLEENESNHVWTSELLDIAHRIDPKCTLGPEGRVIFYEPNGLQTSYTAKAFKEYLHVLSTNPTFIKLTGIMDRAREQKRIENEVRAKAKLEEMRIEQELKTKILLEQSQVEKEKLEEAFRGFGVLPEQLHSVSGFDAFTIDQQKMILKTLNQLLDTYALVRAEDEINNTDTETRSGFRRKKVEKLVNALPTEDIKNRAEEIKRKVILGGLEHLIESLVLHLKSGRDITDAAAIAAFLGTFKRHVLSEGEVVDTQPNELDVTPKQKIQNSEGIKPVVKDEVAHEKPVEQFIEAYTKEFGIQREDLESIEGYERLSEGQRVLLYENFKAITLGSVPEEAVRLYEASRAAGREEKVLKYGKLCGGAIAALREAFTKEGAIELGEKDVLKRMRTAGFELHKNILTQLIHSAATYGPRVHIENGELAVDFLNTRERATGKARGPEWRAMEDFNTQAHAFARTPDAWRGNTLGVDGGTESRVSSWFKQRFSTEYKNQQKFAAAEAAYLDARLHLTRTWKHQGKTDQEIARYLMDADARVSQQQMLNTAPEALEALAAVEDTSLWKHVAKRIVTSGSLGYMALGFVSRTLAGAAVGVLGAPVAAAGIAAARSWNKTAAEMRERDRLAREGVKDTKDGALNVVSAVEYITVRDADGKERRMDRGLIQKTVELIEKYRALEYEGDQDTNRREKILKSLRERVDYINDKQRLGRVNYGSREERVAHQTRLYAVLGEALAIIADTDAPENARLKERLAQKISRSEARIRGVRQEYRSTELQLSAYKAAGFSIAGALLAHAFQDLDVVKKIRDVFGGGSIDTVADGVQPEPIVPGVPEVPQPEIAAQSLPTEAVSAERMIPTLGKHHVQEGDTLMKIFREQIPEIKALGTRQEQDTVIMNLLRSMTKTELEGINVTSNNPNLIKVGAVIDLDKVSQMLIDRKR